MAAPTPLQIPRNKDNPLAFLPADAEDIPTEPEKLAALWLWDRFCQKKGLLLAAPEPANGE